MTICEISSYPEISEDVKQRFLTACCDRRRDTLEEMLSTYGDRLAKVTGDVLHRPLGFWEFMSNMGLKPSSDDMDKEIVSEDNDDMDDCSLSTGNPLHHALLGRIHKATPYDQNLVEIVKLLLDHGADATEANRIKGTPLHMVFGREYNLRSPLLYANPIPFNSFGMSDDEIKANRHERFNKDVAHKASVLRGRACKIEIANLLLKAGADPTLPNSANMSPLMKASEASNDVHELTSLYHHYNRDFLEETKRKLASKSSDSEPDSHAQVGTKNLFDQSLLPNRLFTVIHEIGKRNFPEGSKDVVQKALQHGENIHETNSLDLEPLGFVFVHPLPKIVPDENEMVQEIVDVKAVGDYVQKVIALWNGMANRLEVVNLLLEAGADSTHVTRFGDVPQIMELCSTVDYWRPAISKIFEMYCPGHLKKTEERRRVRELEDKMFDAVYTNDAEALNQTISEGGDVNMLVDLGSNKKRPLIFQALSIGRYAIASQLIDRGASVKQTMKSGDHEVDLLDIMITQFDAGVFSRLIDKGLNPNKRYTSTEEHDFSTDIFWHALALLGNVKAIEILIDKKIPLQMTSKSGTHIYDMLQPAEGSEIAKHYEMHKKQMEEALLKMQNDLLEKGIDLYLFPKLQKIVDRINFLQKEWRYFSSSSDSSDEEEPAPKDPYNTFHPELRDDMRQLVDEGHTLEHIKFIVCSKEFMKSFDILSLPYLTFLNLYKNSHELVDGGGESHKNILKMLSLFFTIS